MALLHPAHPHTDTYAPLSASTRLSTCTRWMPRDRWAGKQASSQVEGFSPGDLSPLGFTSIESLKELVFTCGLSASPPPAWNPAAQTWAHGTWKASHLIKNDVSVSGEGLGCFPSDLARGKHAPPPPSPPSRSRSFLFSLRLWCAALKSCWEANLSLLLWCLFVGVRQGNGGGCQDLPHCWEMASLPSPSHGCW